MICQSPISKSSEQQVDRSECRHTIAEGGLVVNNAGADQSYNKCVLVRLSKQTKKH